MSTTKVSDQPIPPGSIGSKFNNLQFFERMGRTFVTNSKALTFYEIPQSASRELRRVLSRTDTSHRQDRETSGDEQRPLFKKWIENLNPMNSAGVAEIDEQIETQLKFTQKKRNKQAFSLNITHRCNLGCSYCFAEPTYLSRPPREGADEETTGIALPVINPNTTDNSKLGVMTREDADRSIEYMLEAAQGDFTVGFFGGEAMTEFSLMEYIVARLNRLAASDNRTVSWGLTTNGTIATQRQIEFLAENNFALIVSFDGTREQHDRHRPFFRSTQGSYDLVLRNLLSKFLPVIKNVTVRATAPVEEIDFDVIGRSMLDIGATQFSIEPASNMVDNYQPEQFHRVVDSLEQWAETFCQKRRQQPFDFYYFTSLIRRICRREPVIRACGAGNGYQSIAADGSLWPCHLWTGNTDGGQNWQMGSVATGEDRDDLAQLFQSINITARDGCHKCWARLVCGGFCYVPRATTPQVEAGKRYPRAAEFECNFMRALIEVTTWIIAELKDTAPDVLQDILATSSELAPGLDVFDSSGCSC
ncbi:MAG: radical SAM protein [Planctomycetota bacterium]